MTRQKYPPQVLKEGTSHNVKKEVLSSIPLGIVGTGSLV